MTTRAKAFTILLAATFIAALPASAQRRRVPNQVDRPAIPSPCSPAPLAPPTYAFQLDATPWFTCGSRAWPFSATYSPDGADLWVPLFGGFLGGGGCALARLDPSTFALRAVIPTGESPEEVAFVTHANGTMRFGFVTNSSSSTVTVFNASNQVTATIPIPPDPSGPYPTAFPFGLAVSPDQATVHVGTGDGQGLVHAIDVNTLALDPSRAIALGPDRGVARMAFAGSRLVLTVTEFFPGFTGSEASVIVVDPQQPQIHRSLVLATENGTGLFPSPQDLAVDCDGVVWVAGFDMGTRVYGARVNGPGPPQLSHTIATQTAQPDGKFQALGLSADGMLVVGDFWTHELSVIDARRRTWLTTIDLTTAAGTFRSPQEITFSPDGGQMIIPCAATDSIAIFNR
ncbi:MAG: DNA-binding beta-propeller fold protein YncE [Planctomycetota bacterium]|jgi:DNA-binding beta-propeller fold protein YncE